MEELNSSKLKNFFAVLLSIKFKYVVSFISIVVFYVCLFEKRYFQINSDWKVFCYKNDYSICHFDLKLVNVSADQVMHLAILSKSDNHLVIVDLLNSSLTNADVLSEPKITFEKVMLDNFVSFDILKSKGLVTFVGITETGVIYHYVNWELIYKRIIISDIPSIVSLKIHSLKIIPNEDIFLIAGQGYGPSIQDIRTVMVSLNASNGNIIWRVFLNDNKNATLIKKEKNSDGAVFDHWKLKLLQRHLDLDHLKEKSYHVYMKEFYPIYCDSKITMKLIRAYKSIGLINKEIKPTKAGNDNYNSVLVIHSSGFNLLDIVSGTVLATEEAKLDSHSAYTKWPSTDHGLEEDVYVVKFVSKLDHYSKDNIDIHHIHDSDSDDLNVHQHKIHCNLLFHKLYTRSTLEHGPRSFSVGHLCDPVNYMDYPRFGEKSWLEDPSKSVPPLITDDHATPSGLWGRIYHVIGRKLMDTNSKNVIGISSDGLVTSYSSHGHINWRINAQVGWLHISRMVNTNSGFPIDDNTREVYTNHFRPSLTSVTLTYFNQNIKAIVAIGFESLSLIDLSDGYLLASHSLPCTPVDKPLIASTPSKGFFSMSGDQIVIVKCENMILGFSLIHYIPWTYFIVICALMVVGLLLVMWGLDPNNQYLHEFWI